MMLVGLQQQSAGLDQMSMKNEQEKSAIARLHRDENGAVSVEFVIWLPILMAVGLMITDASAAFTTQASMWRTAGDLARGLATGRISTQQAEARIADSSSFTLAITLPGNDGIVTVELSRPYSMIGTGFLLSPMGTMQVQLRQYVEPTVFFN